MKTSPQLLIVDDDADDREIIRDAFAATLSAAEYVCLENGDRLIEHLEGQLEHTLPALILLDLNMPGKDGRETLKDIKTDKRYQHIPVVVFTTSSSHRDRLMAYELGANCFITKPDTFNKLVELTGCIARLWIQ